jgi:tousled-like kinase
METIQDAKERTTESLVIFLRELEEMKRNKQKEWVNNQSFKIGKIKSYSQGNRMGQIWEDGVEVKFAKQDLEKINKEKEEEKKAKRKIPSTNFDKLEEAKFKMEKLNRSEADVKEKLVKYYKERIVLEAEDRRLTEENKSTYMKKNWPILNKRYLILSLIGKGGYSEVYKAYDLLNHINVACKIHQLEHSWSETVKELYIRHTIRENQIHQKINHEKILQVNLSVIYENIHKNRIYR